MYIDNVETVYVTIGNTDNKLTQQEWSQFCSDVFRCVQDASNYIVFHGFSLPSAPYQNAVVAFTRMASVDGREEERERILRQRLSILASKFKQESIAWSVGQVEFLTPDPNAYKGN